MFDEASHYLRVTRASGLYKDDALDALRTLPLKQLWRNHLLGEAMIQAGDIDVFTSLLVHPAGNPHCASARLGYQAMLRAGGFVAVTYEEHLARCAALAGDNVAAGGWLRYLQQRYLLP